MEVKQTELSRSLNIIYQPHPITPILGRKGMVAAIQEGTSVREILLSAGIDPHQPIVILLDDRLLTVEEWDIICPTDGQMLNVQTIVQGGGGGGNSNPLQTVLLIAVVVAATVVSAGALAPLLGSAFAAGAVGAAVAGAIIGIGGSLLIGALFPPKSTSDAVGTLPEVSPTYSLTGGSNQQRPYQSMPVVMGTHRVFPDFGSKPFTEYRGEDQYLYQIFHFGLGSISVSDYKIGANPLSNYSDVELFQPNSDGQLTQFPGNVDSAAGAALTNAAGWINRTTSANTYRIAIDIEAILFETFRDGRLITTSVEFEIQYRSASSGEYVAIPSNNYYFRAVTAAADGRFTIIGFTQKPQRGSIFIDVPVGQYDIRIRRITPDSTNPSIVQNTNFSTLRSYQLDNGNYRGQNRVGLVIKASEQLNGVVQQLSATVSASATYWNGSVWVTGATSNPAHWFMHFARGVYNADGVLMYGVGLTESQLDLGALTVWANFCNTENLTFNAIIDGSQNAADILNLIGKAGFGSPSWASGKLGIVFDARDASPVASFGMSNIIRNSFEVQYITEQLAEEIVVRFRNPDKDWEQDEVRTTVPGITNPQRISQVEMFGCTNATMAGKFSNYLAAQQFYRKRRISWQTDFEGFVCQRGDVVLLSHDLTQWGYSGRFVSVSGLNVTLDRAVPRSGSLEYLMLIRPDGSTTTYNVTAATGESATLTLQNFPVFQEGADLIDHRWCFSPLATPGKKVKIISVAPASDSRLQIVATDEDPGFYNAWGGTFVPPETSTVLPAQPVTITNLTLASRVAFVNGYLTNRVAISWGVGGGTLYSRVRIFLDGLLLQELPQNLTQYYEIDISGAGSLFVEVTPFGVTGSGQRATSSLTLFAIDFPAPPTNLALEVGEDGKSATYTWDAVLGVQSYVISVVVGGVSRRTVNIGNTLSYVYTLDDAIADGGAFREYELRVYSVNQAGQSLTFASVTFSNPQIGALQNAAIEPMPNSLWFQCDRPTEPDFQAIRIWISKTLDFTPSDSTIAYDGAENWVTISADNQGNPLESGVTYYLRAAGYDSFGDDNLTLTGQFSASILSPAWGLLEGDIQEALLDSGLRDRIDLIDRTGDPDMPDGLITAVRRDATDISVLNNSVDTIGEKLLESALKIQDNTDLLYDAGVTIDSTTGEVYIFGVRENANEINEVGIRLSAAESQILLRATTTYVDNAILTAVIDPSQIAELGALEARVSSAEIEIDGLESAITLKADLLIVNSQGARLTTAEADIDALEGQIVLKANNTDLSATEARVSTVETTLSALDVPSINFAVQDVRYLNKNQDQIAVTQLQDILTGQANYDDLSVGIAKASLDLVAYTDGQVLAEASARLEVAAALENTAAALAQESIARATADDAEAAQRLALAAVVSDNTAAIASESLARANADSALSSQITTLQATTSSNTAAINTEVIARTDADSALASEIVTLSSVVDGNITSIQTTAETVDGIQGKYTVKIDNNGFVSGYGLISTANNSVPFADFAVIADRFSISPVASGVSANPASPFFVLTSPTVIDGVTIPAGTYMKKAFIHNATINTAKIEDAAITTAKIQDASINTAKIIDATITTAKIQDAAITNAKIVDAAITTAKIADANISRAKIQNAAIDNAKIDNAAITTAKIADAQITTAKIVNLAVDTLKIQGNAVTVPVNAISGSVVAGNGAYQSVISLTVTNSSSVFMPVVVFFSAVVGYSAGVRSVGFAINDNTSQLGSFGIFSGGFVSLPSFQVYSGVNPFSSNTFTVFYYGEDATVQMGFKSLTALGVKR